MKTDKGETSFRQWNPERLDVPWGEDNSSYPEEDFKKDEGAALCFCFQISTCIEKLFKYSFQEVINVMKPGIVFKEEVINQLKQQNATISRLARFGAWILFCWGVFLLFSPIINLFKFIPLIGYFLENIVSFAAVMFAFVIGSVLHIMTLVVAWFFHRPCFAMFLLVSVSLLISLLFMGGQHQS